jgi:uncharacterized protein (TIGR03435 family)
MWCRLLWAVALVSASTVIFAQNGKPLVTLEAAAVKAAPPDMPPLVPGNWAPPTSSSARLRPMTLRTLVMYAFDIVPRRHDPEPVGGPAWFDKTAYQLVLKFSDVPTVPQAQTAIRTLLEERFKLRWHIERRELPVYALVVARPDGKLGPGLRPSKVDCGAYSDTLARTGRGAVAKEVTPACGLTSGGAPAVATVTSLTQTYPRGAQVIHGTATMREIVQAMMRSDRENDRAIVDRSGLTDTLDIHLWWVPVRSGGIVPDSADVMTLGTAVQQQLGLKLEPRREPRDVIVIDSAEVPVLD